MAETGMGWGDPFGIGTIANAGGNLLAGAFGGGGPQGSGGSIVSPMQRLMIYNLQRRALEGNLGDMGGGSAYRQGAANFGQAMEDRGVSPTSGAYMAGLGNIATQAGQMDQQNLMDRMLQIAGLQVQVGPERWKEAGAGIPTGYLGQQYGAPGGEVAGGPPPAPATDSTSEMMRRRLAGQPNGFRLGFGGSRA